MSEACGAPRQVASSGRIHFLRLLCRLFRPLIALCCRLTRKTAPRASFVHRRREHELLRHAPDVDARAAKATAGALLAGKAAGGLPRLRREPERYHRGRGVPAAAGAHSARPARTFMPMVLIILSKTSRGEYLVMMSAGFSTPLTSWPMRLRVATTSSTVKSPSRWSSHQ